MACPFYSVVLNSLSDEKDKALSMHNNYTVIKLLITQGILWNIVT